VPDIGQHLDCYIRAILAGRLVGVEKELPSLGVLMALLAIWVACTYQRGSLMRSSVRMVFSTSNAEGAAYLLVKARSYCVASHRAMISHHRMRIGVGVVQDTALV
jgi:hypothetical protein